VPLVDAEPCTLAIVRRRDVADPVAGPTLIDAVTYFSWLLQVGATGILPVYAAVNFFASESRPLDDDSQVVLERFELLWPKGTATERTRGSQPAPTPSLAPAASTWPTGTQTGTHHPHSG
jgi:hypothetical protein